MGIFHWEDNWFSPGNMLDLICLDFSKTFDMVLIGNATDIWEERDEYYNCMTGKEQAT